MFSFPTGTHHYAASPLDTVHDVRLVGGWALTGDSLLPWRDSVSHSKLHIGTWACQYLV